MDGTVSRDAKSNKEIFIKCIPARICSPPDLLPVQLHQEDHHSCHWNYNMHKKLKNEYRFHVLKQENVLKTANILFYELGFLTYWCRKYYLRFIDSILLFSRIAPARLENPYLHFQNQQKKQSGKTPYIDTKWDNKKYNKLLCHTE